MTGASRYPRAHEWACEYVLNHYSGTEPLEAFTATNALCRPQPDMMPSQRTVDSPRGLVRTARDPRVEPQAPHVACPRRRVAATDRQPAQQSPDRVLGPLPGAGRGETAVVGVELARRPGRPLAQGQVSERAHGY